MTRYAMALNTHTCIGCLACTVACKVENGSPEGLWYAPVTSQEFGAFPDVRRAFLPLLCNHCTDAPCLKACPTGAIHRRPDGIVLIDQDRCCGSRACVIACPYGAIHYYETPQTPHTPFDEVKLKRHTAGTAQKCTFCAPRLDRGLNPACIDVCPTGARIFGDLDDPQSRVSKAFAAADATPLAAPVDTKPNTRYLSRGVIHAGGAADDIALAYRPQRQWGLHQAVQFAMFGLAAGLVAATRLQPATAELAGRQFDLGALLSLALFCLGGLVLIAHLGKPLRFAQALRNWRTSWISRGAVADVVFLAVLVALIPAYRSSFRGVLDAAAVLAGVTIAAYPALAMRAMTSTPLWRGAGLPLKFLIDAFLMGAGVAGLLTSYGASLIVGIGALAVLRLLAALWRPEASAAIAPLAASIAILAGAALAVPAIAPIAGGLSATLALALGFLSKHATLRAGESPAPFGPKGELRGPRDAGR